MSFAGYVVLQGVAWGSGLQGIAGHCRIVLQGIAGSAQGARRSPGERVWIGVIIRSWTTELPEPPTPKGLMIFWRHPAFKSCFPRSKFIARIVFRCPTFIPHHVFCSATRYFTPCFSWPEFHFTPCFSWPQISFHSTFFVAPNFISLHVFRAPNLISLHAFRSPFWLVS